MANSLNENIEGRVVLLKEDAMAEGYRDRKWRLFLVRGGFGAVSYTTGRALAGTFLEDGEKTRMSGYAVEEIVADSIDEYDGYVHPSILDDEKDQ